MTTTALYIFNLAFQSVGLHDIHCGSLELLCLSPHLLLWLLCYVWILSSEPLDTLHNVQQSSSSSIHSRANFPDVMLPAYRCSPFYSLFFILFISSGIYFILNFLVGYIYSFYEAQNKANLLYSCWSHNYGCRQAYDRIVCGLDAAFYTLCTTRGIPFHPLYSYVEVSDDEEDVDPGIDSSLGLIH